jgi:hypothetical protein
MDLAKRRLFKDLWLGRSVLDRFRTRENGAVM